MGRKGRLKGFLLFLQRENIFRLFLILVGLLLASTVGFAAFEPGATWISALWWSVVTLTTVGYGDISPVTLGGRIIGVVVMLLGIGTLGMFTATIASVLVERRMKEDRGMRSYDFEHHLILCEWNHRAHDILQELRADPRSETLPVVLIADLEMKPLDDEFLFFIQGPVNEETLRRANLEKAETVVILGDDRLDASARDAKTVLSTLTIESINPNAYSIVELVDGTNTRHCERANADEVIVGSEFNSKLISRAALDHGISKVLSELLSSRFGNDLSKVPVPVELEDSSFIDVFTAMKRTRQSIVLAVQRGTEVVSNPDPAFRVEPGDHLIVICAGEPVRP